MLLANDQLKLSFTASGALQSLQYRGCEFIAASPLPRIFTLHLRNSKGELTVVTGDRFSRCDFYPSVNGQNQSALELHFSGLARLETMQVCVKIRLDDTGMSFWHIKVSGIGDDICCESLLFPEFELINQLKGHGGDGEFFWPGSEGVIFTEFDTRNNSGFASGLLEYPLTGIGGYYPGPVPMQFQAYTTPGGSLYLGCHDPGHSPKGIDVNYGETRQSIRPMFQYFTGGVIPSQVELPGEAVIGGFDGDWQEAAMIYRDWMERFDHTLPLKLKDNPAVPDWLKNSPVLLAYPVKGSGFDTGSLDGNEYFPYANALPVLEEYQRRWQTPVMALLMHWEGTAPWAPPYVWPPFGGEAMLRDFADRLHAKGNLLGVYCSGIGWTQTSSIDPRYSRIDDFERQELKNEMCLGPQGEMFAKVCNGEPGKGQRIGFEMCPARPWTVGTVTGEVTKIVGANVDYLQFFDQNQGCSAPLCYAKDHGHPPFPGQWLTDAMRALLAQTRAAAGDKVVLGCENGAAEPYLGDLQLNDLRNHLAWCYAQPVPAYSMVFHEYVNNFTGNGVCLAQWFDREVSPWFLHYRTAYSFISGEILSAVLKGQGEMHWSWVCDWRDKGPDQPSLSKLIGNLNRVRATCGKNFLVFGRMLKNVEVECSKQILYFKNHHLPLELPTVLASRWQFEDTQAIFAVNPFDWKQSVRIKLPEKSSGVYGENPVSLKKCTAKFADVNELSITISPHSVVMIKLNLSGGLNHKL